MAVTSPQPVFSMPSGSSPGTKIHNLNVRRVMDEIQRQKKKNSGKTDICGETQRTWWVLRIWKYASFAERVSLKKLIKANNSYNEKQVSLLFFSKDKLQYAPSLHDTKNCLKEYLRPGDNPTFLVNYFTLKKNHQIEEQLILKGNKNYPLDNRQDSWDLNLMSTFHSLLINLFSEVRRKCKT